MSTAYKKPEIQTNHSNFPTLLYFLATLILYGWGMVSAFLILFDEKNQPLINDFLLKLGISIGLLPFLLLFFALYLPLMFIFGYILLKLISWLAQEITIFVSVLSPFIFIGVGLWLFSLGGSIIGLIISGFGGLMLLIVLFKFQSLKRSGKFVEFSAKFVLDEKAVLWPPVILGLFTLYSGVFLFFGFAEINNLFMVTTSNGQELSPVGLVASFLYSYFYLIVYFGIYYVLQAGVISYAMDWYRELDPDKGSASKDVRQVLPVILSFALVSTTIKVIMGLAQSFARDSSTSSTQSSGRGGGRGGTQGIGIVFGILLSILTGILGAIWSFVNYFTLVSVIENKQGLRESIKDSAYTRWNSFLDVLVGDTGFGLTMFIFFIINTLLWFAGGMAFTFVLFPTGILGIPSIFLGLIIGIFFVILGFFPYNLVTSPMRIAFTTFLYAYAKDSIEGYTKPSRLPAEFRNEFTKLQQRSKKRKMRDPTQYL